jgi:hypothetical protein
MLLISLGMLCSCHSRQEAVKSTETQQRKYEADALQLIIAWDKPRYTVAERPSLSIEIISSKEIEVSAPAIGEKLGQFLVVDRKVSQSTEPETGRLVQRHCYVLEPFLSGDYTIPPLEIVSRSKIQPGYTNTLKTEEIILPVVSLFSGVVTNQLIRDIPLPIELPKGAPRILWLGYAIFFSVVVALFWWRYHLHSPSTLYAKKPNALEALEQLLAEGWVQRGEVKVFYQKLTMLLRLYLEERFSLHAPEQTTREFIASLARTHWMPVQHKQLLQDFLKYCDLVKFAEHQPSMQDVENTIACYKYFVMETAEPGMVSGEGNHAINQQNNA